MCKLGFGTMRLPVDVQGNIDNKLLMQMIDIYISNGFTYFYTAYGYMGQRSETALKECLVERYSRDTLFDILRALRTEIIREEKAPQIYKQEEALYNQVKLAEYSQSFC